MALFLTFLDGISFFFFLTPFWDVYNPLPAEVAIRISMSSIPGVWCTIVEPNLSKYRGQIQKWKPHGWGKKQYKNGSSYVGGWRNGVPHGRGKLTISAAQMRRWILAKGQLLAAYTEVKQLPPTPPRRSARLARVGVGACLKK